MVRAQGTKETWCSVSSGLGCMPFVDVAVRAGTPQLLRLYSKLDQHEAALIWKPQRASSNRPILDRGPPETMLMSDQSWLLPGKHQGLQKSSASIWTCPCRQVPDLL